MTSFILALKFLVILTAANTVPLESLLEQLPEDSNLDCSFKREQRLTQNQSSSASGPYLQEEVRDIRHLTWNLCGFVGWGAEGIFL